MDFITHPDVATDDMGDIEAWSGSEEDENPLNFAEGWPMDESKIFASMSPYIHALNSSSLDEWIHLRFCYVYKVHGWIHDPMSRAILFSHFAAGKQLPTPALVPEAVHISRRLPALSQLPNEIWEVIVDLLIISGLIDWSRDKRGKLLEWADEEVWDPPLSSLSLNERGMTAICSDAVKLLYTGTLFCTGGNALSRITAFLLDPHTALPDEVDVVSLPLSTGGSASEQRIYHSEDAARHAEFLLPKMLSSRCSCGECPAINAEMVQSHNLRTSYFDITGNASGRGCSAIEDSWDPLLEKAEKWLEQHMHRVVSAQDVFPDYDGRRLGPTILDVMHSAQWSFERRLSFIETLEAVLMIYYYHSPENRTFPIYIPLPCDLDGLGFVFAEVPSSPGLKVLNKNDTTSFVLITCGGWLYDFGLTRPGDDNSQLIHFVFDDKDTTIDYAVLAGVANPAVCLPFAKPDIPFIPTVDHEAIPDSEVNFLPAVESEGIHEERCHLYIHLRNSTISGFPLLTVASPFQKHRKGALAMQLSTYYQDRFIRTWTRPDVMVGRACGHSEDYGVQTRCSVASNVLLSRIKPESEEFRLRREETNKPYLPMSREECEMALQELLENWADRIKDLTDASGPLSKNKVCIVRCGSMEGPPDPIVILAGALGKKVYIFHSLECWQCAHVRMLQSGRTVGIANETKVLSHCPHCRT
ncbi:hypothetical protein SISNIDRAFT_292119 [Sistotremastrum niveocremeum HHB9708]|uniref:Uncharacterized protein n=2 Tax=Sistotremastraceae TaxID=3402574 RepID=A0A164YKI2_9AGAM|nr:hypothetical protein SISNIDRAFT_292119 [Sistotremastrum niveocremeum HHB9708]KZT43423.1 hypothetical protein SISSUDRAFT_694672 [Sistotremastrum suecicum HHB10207 ss-3]